MSGFVKRRPFVKGEQFMPHKIATVARPAVVRPMTIPVARRTKPVNTQAALDAYAAEDAKERKKKLDAVIKTQKKLVTASTELKATKVVEAQKKVAKDIVPNHHDKTQPIKEYNDAVGAHKDAKDDHAQAKKDHQVAKAAAQAGAGRRHTRHKRRKSKHRRHKRRTKRRRRKRHTKKRKRHTKKRRSRRR